MPEIKEHVIVAFDIGTKRIGVAVGQTLTQSATALDTLIVKGQEPTKELFQAIFKEYRPTQCIVGIPIHMDGTEQPITRFARKVASAIASWFNVPVFGIDERLSTKEAKSRVFEQGGYKKLSRSQIDSVAAQILLEQWLNQKGSDYEQF